MDNQQRKSNSLLTHALGVIIAAAIYNTASANDSTVKADTATPTDIMCMMNWAQTFYPNLFSPPVSDVQFSSPYTYRYYSDTNAYVGVSSAYNHGYYLGPEDASPQDMGALSTLLQESGCGDKPCPVIVIYGFASF